MVFFPLNNCCQFGKCGYSFSLSRILSVINYNDKSLSDNPMVTRFKSLPLFPTISNEHITVDNNSHEKVKKKKLASLLTHQCRSRGIKARCFELLLRDAAQVRSPVGDEFSASVWDRCQPCIVRNLSSYWFIIPV